MADLSEYGHSEIEKQKCVLLKSVILTAVALSSKGINNRTLIHLNAVEAVWSINKITGVDYMGGDEGVISKIIAMEDED